MGGGAVLGNWAMGWWGGGVVGRWGGVAVGVRSPTPTPTLTLPRLLLYRSLPVERQRHRHDGHKAVLNGCLRVLGELALGREYMHEHREEAVEEPDTVGHTFVVRMAFEARRHGPGLVQQVAHA